MNSLKVKILVLTTAILVMTVGLTAWHNLRTQKAILDRLIHQNGRILGETICYAVVTHMASGQNSEVARILENVRREPAVESARIFNETGRIVFSADPEEIGDRVAASDLLASRSGKFFFSETLKGEKAYSTLVPIYNAPVCHRCHEQSAKVLGILNIHLSPTELEVLQAKEREATFLSSLAMLAILVLSISGFILIYVEAPIRKLISAMTHVEQGDFAKVNVEVRSSNEMALLSSKFNLMAKRLIDLIHTTVRNEREIAVSQEKLAHHDEIRNMNITLEERLKEIEFLNITLEERIEEIEEANYKISDLAADLESKNTILEQAVARLSALYEMGLAINSTMDLDKLFHLLIRRTMETLEARVGYILLLNREAGILTIAGAVGMPEHIHPETQIPLEPGGVSHWVIKNRRPLLIPDIAETEDFHRRSRLGFDRQTVICAPLFIKEEVIGTITMNNKRDETGFNPEDLDLLSTIAAQASVAINNARLYEEQQASYLNTVQALVSTIEASDAYTRGHSERVTRYSLALARHLNLDPDALLRLEQAAILHDIGKIGIDVALLHKEEKLSVDDVGVLRQHPVIGVRILEPIQFLQGVRKIIEQHHERFDGMGYPHGLRGDHILMESRVLAVADAFDAMTSDRPYRQALPLEMALREIEKQSGGQFDPGVVGTFIRICRDGGLES